MKGKPVFTKEEYFAMLNQRYNQMTAPPSAAAPMPMQDGRAVIEKLLKAKQAVK